ncbi:putative sulfate/molybdate transporter [Salinigranum salinum]|uniref:putative sulfate/molybdate transporter n=1 Tax=Salinigranum salinum TaxID=1364937 RepID=UPI0012609872|nr:putative sulfate/molybdate transporter [Salinigranum salinum]
MAFSTENPHDWSIRISVDELTGAIGDSVTVLPIVVAVTALTPLSLPRVLLGFALFQAVWGLHYRLPLSVEPMKALAALVIAGSLTVDELAAAGLLAGVALLVVGRTDGLARVQRFVSRPVVRGVQLAVALVLLRTAFDLSFGAPALAVAAVVVACATALVVSGNASTLVVLGLGVVLAFSRAGPTALSFAVPSLAPTLPPASALTGATADGVVGQLAMTVGNAAVATSLLLSEYFDAEVSPDDLATSMGVMNLVAVPLGALPMCHGSGGVAGKYAFGARTAGANLLLAAGYALVAVFAVGIFPSFPMAVLGVLLALVAVELGRSALRTERLWLTVAVGLCGLVTNVGVAFVAGAALSLFLRRLRPIDGVSVAGS